MNNIYTSGEYIAKNPTWHEEDSSWKAKQILSAIRLSNIVPGSVCEIGCGSGEILHQLQDMMPCGVFFGYEISPQAFEICTKKANDRLHFFNNDFMTIQERRFDLILLIDLLEHLEDYFSFLRKVKSHAEYFIIHFPIDLSVQGIIFNRPMVARNKFGHIQYFTKETALQSLIDTGFEIINHFYTGTALDCNHNNNLKKRIANIPRKFLFNINNDFGVRIMGGYSLMVVAKS